MKKIKIILILFLILNNYKINCSGELTNIVSTTVGLGVGAMAAVLSKPLFFEKYNLQVLGFKIGNIQTEKERKWLKDLKDLILKKGYKISNEELKYIIYGMQSIIGIFVYKIIKNVYKN